MERQTLSPMPRRHPLRLLAWAYALAAAGKGDPALWWQGMHSSMESFLYPMDKDSIPVFMYGELMGTGDDDLLTLVQGDLGKNLGVGYLEHYVLEKDTGSGPRLAYTDNEDMVVQGMLSASSDDFFSDADLVMEQRGMTRVACVLSDGLLAYTYIPEYMEATQLGEFCPLEGDEDHC